jgi:hypothetical protein
LLSGRCVMVKTSVFQTEDAGSIPAARSIIVGKSFYIWEIKIRAFNLTHTLARKRSSSILAV